MGIFSLDLLNLGKDVGWLAAIDCFLSNFMTTLVADNFFTCYVHAFLQGCLNDKVLLTYYTL
jgi:hypothetical protein